MKYLNSLIIALVILLGLGTFTGIGRVHESTSSASTHHTTSHESMSHCQSVCLPAASERLKGTIFERDDEPNPLPFWAEYSSIGIVSWYLIVAVIASLLFIIFRPPDLVLQYGNWRN